MEKEVSFTIGPYQVSKIIGEGEFGEVFLAFDPRCGRKVALKRVRSNLPGDKRACGHILYEARLTSQLVHSSITPVYDIIDDPELPYFTMSYIEGMRLDRLITLGREEESSGMPLDPRVTVSALLEIFLKVCQAVSYAHARGVIHRDLKPSNIMIGDYGEVVVLDWGIAKLMPQDSKDISESDEPVKLSGTVPYVAPEQIIGKDADYRTDIYSLGLILYEMLTLRRPFHHDSISHYRHIFEYEVLLDPAKVAPYRGITPILSSIVLKCLCIERNDRYQTVRELLFDLENYLAKHSDWFKTAAFDPGKRSEWEKKSGNPVEKKLRALSPSETFLISKSPYADLLRLNFKVKLGRGCKGIGILLGISSAADWPACRNGFCVWLSGNFTKGSKLFLLDDKEISLKDVFLPSPQWQEVEIEKIDTLLNVYLNQKLQFSYVQHFPISDSHFGLWLPKNCEVKEGDIYIGGYSFKPNPLAVPNALYAHHHVDEALSEYRQVALQQPLTAEGRKAIFRTGVALLEKGRVASMEEFKKLSDPSAAPLGLLGEALTFRSQQKYAEEVECFETAFERYQAHPLIPVWHHELLSRLLESEQFDHFLLCRLLLLASRYLPEDLFTPGINALLVSYIYEEAPLYFLNDQYANSWTESQQRLSKTIRLAFYLARTEVLAAVIDEELKLPAPHLYSLANAFCALLELGAYGLVLRKLEAIYKVMLDVQALANFEWIREAALFHYKKDGGLPDTLMSTLPVSLNKQSLRIVIHILYEMLRRNQADLVLENIDNIETKHTIDKDGKSILTCFRIWAHLLNKDWENAKKIGENASFKGDFGYISERFLLNCYIAATEQSIVKTEDISQIINDSLKSFLSEASMWEKRVFYRQMVLYAHCLGSEPLKEQFEALERGEFIT